MSDNGLGYCLCGAPKRHTCGVCGRALCEWHSAGGPFSDMAGGVELAAVCLPECGALWWQELATQHERGETPREEGVT